jgi:hypothetical protein
VAEEQSAEQQAAAQEAADAEAAATAPDLGPQPPPGPNSESFGPGAGVAAISSVRTLGADDAAGEGHVKVEILFDIVSYTDNDGASQTATKGQVVGMPQKEVDRLTSAEAALPGGRVAVKTAE